MPPPTPLGSYSHRPASPPSTASRASPFRRFVACFTAVCFLTTQTAAVAGPHEQGVAAGQAANPVARGNVTTPGATAVVPGDTTTPPERSHYRQPNLSSQGSARLAACSLTPTDPLCQAQRGAVSSANTPRPTVGANDPAVAAARAIGRTPSVELGSLAACCSGCTTTVTPVPAGMQPRSCLRYLGVGNYSCLSVGRMVAGHFVAVQHAQLGSVAGAAGAGCGATRVEGAAARWVQR